MEQRRIPSVLGEKSFLELMRAKDADEAIQSNGESDPFGYFQLLAAYKWAWGREFDPPKLIRYYSNVCGICGNARVIPDWAAAAYFSRLIIPARYADPAGWIATPCPRCKPHVQQLHLPPPPAGDACGACEGEGLLPYWAEALIRTGDSDEAIKLKQTGTQWTPRACCVCGGWGRLPIISEVAAATVTPLVSSDSDPLTGDFIYEGDVWRIRFRGHSIFRIKNLAGLRYLALLLFYKRPISAIVVARGGRMHDSLDRLPIDEAMSIRSSFGSGQRISDRKARTVIQGKLKSLREELDLETDPERKLILKEEICQFESQAKALDAVPGEYDRSAKNCADTVRKQIQGAVERIRAHCPPLAAHLKASLRYTSQPYYTPAEPIDWSVILP